MIRLPTPQFTAVRQHPVAAELALSAKRLRLAWRIWRLSASERRAAVDIAYDRLYLKQREQNFNELLIDNSILRADYARQLQALKEQ
jgi:hypothetical protein